jgi:hypothetical protein
MDTVWSEFLRVGRAVTVTGAITLSKYKVGLAGKNTAAAVAHHRRHRHRRTFPHGQLKPRARRVNFAKRERDDATHRWLMTSTALVPRTWTCTCCSALLGITISMEFHLYCFRIPPLEPSRVRVSAVDRELPSPPRGR